MFSHKSANMDAHPVKDEYPLQGFIPTSAYNSGLFEFHGPFPEARERGGRKKRYLGGVRLQIELLKFEAAVFVQCAKNGGGLRRKEERSFEVREVSKMEKKT
ncbi:hypothetical protein L596_028500 [Steinernema carpocapsae]|uniref:Uncharacterized protein n=1 Tax=Steinernema carpocapsae TaxID=34508 RepID=A0A4V5ZXW7_STECR|nr:hypothetical protein L596_028500 [Steinernema carpocapsae]